MPLSSIQHEILALLASRRTPESYVAGSTPLNLNAARYSTDIDIFHDREERVEEAASEDAAVLLTQGYSVEWLRRGHLLYSARVKRGEDRTKLEWVADSDYRFFPTIPDKTFGYLLHPVDLALNKCAAAFGRREPRDVVDVVTIHERVLPLGAVVWATTDKAPGLTPEGIIDEIRRNSRYTEEDFRRVLSDPPVNAADVSTRLRAALKEAEAFVVQMPTSKAGLLFLKDGKVVQPDPTRLDDYETHAGQRRGHWPSSYEISAAMLERYLNP